MKKEKILKEMKQIIERTKAEKRLWFSTANGDSQRYWKLDKKLKKKCIGSQVV